MKNLKADKKMSPLALYQNWEKPNHSLVHIWALKT